MATSNGPAQPWVSPPLPACRHLADPSSDAAELPRSPFVQGRLPIVAGERTMSSGTVDKVIGRIKEVAGKVTGDKRIETEVKAD
jgi:hypothetical protein